MNQFFSTGGPLSQHLDHYEPRPDQLLMAERIAAFLAQPSGRAAAGEPGRGEVIIIEAETGIGKSLAYLVPAVSSGMRVVVSTATINLQDQLIDKEIPLLERVLGREVAAVCVKGRQNYLCLQRWYQHRYSPQMSLVGDEDCDRIEEWLDHTGTGDRAELAWLADNSPLWPKISAHSYQCLGGDCPEWGQCFVNQLRKRAAAARLLVVNHHLYFSDLALRHKGFGEILPRHEAVIFDEAHHLEQVATAFFGTSFSQYQVYDLIGDITRQAEADLEATAADRIIGSAAGLRQRLERFTAQFPARIGRYGLRELVRGLGDWEEQVQLLADGLERLAVQLEGSDGPREGWQLLADRARDLQHSLLFVGMAEGREEAASQVYWYERRERSVSLTATPVNVSEDLRTSLYATVPKIVLTSATLSSGSSFDYIRQRLGLDRETPALQLKSPFDYRSRTILYVPPPGFPEPAAPGYEEALAAQIETLLTISRGRALVLFTSFRGMEQVAAHLTRVLHYPVLIQGSASRARLLERFREQTESVLLAVASFWEGVDIVGESLSAVLIDKLPFEVPTDPVVQARVQAIRDEGGNPFVDFQVPRAVLTLRQGVGRLMRSADDGGLIALLDARLFSKRYGALFLSSLPPSPVTRDMVEIQNFFGMLEKHGNHAGKN